MLPYRYRALTAPDSLKRSDHPKDDAFAQPYCLRPCLSISISYTIIWGRKENVKTLSGSSGEISNRYSGKTENAGLFSESILLAYLTTNQKSFSLLK